MAMATAYSNDCNTHNNNPETFGLLWLDPAVNTRQENREAQRQLRSSINHITTFENANLCRRYIQSVNTYDRLVLIVSGQLGQEIVPLIHHIRQVSSIYVYCMDKLRNERWAKKFQKVKAVTNQLDDLIFQIKRDQSGRMRVEDPLAFDIFTARNNPEQSTTGLNGHFVHSLLLIDVLLRMNPLEEDQQKLIAFCKEKYKGNETELDILREFEKDYSPKEALRWYIRESFLYKMLNKALRSQDIGTLFVFHFIIRDIYNELKRNQCQSPLRVYRGQVLSNDELMNLRKSVGELISINSFFSTSLDSRVALKFLQHADKSDDTQPVLFEVEADPHVVTTKPFANISSFSRFRGEFEVLFMTGSIFRLRSIHQNKDQIWIIRLILCGDNQHDLKTLFEHMKETYGGDNTTTRLTFGQVLSQMGKFDLAEQFYLRLLKELHYRDPLLPSLYYSLGLVLQDKKDLDSSLHCLHKSLEIRLQTFPHNYRDISDCYNAIGTIYRLKGDYNTALSSFNKGIDLLKQTAAADDLTMAYFYSNMAIVYEQQKRYEQALNYNEKALTIREKQLPPNHPDIGLSYSNTGNIYYCLGHYHLASDCYNRSLKIRLKSLPPDHPHITQNYENLGLTHESIGELKDALSFYQKVAASHRKSLHRQHAHVVRIEEDIKRVSSQLK